MPLNDDHPPRGVAPLSRPLASDLEPAAAARARRASALAMHPLALAWAYRARLDAVCLQAAADGTAIDPWHLAAVLEGVRLHLDPAAAIVDRGAIFDAARHALTLYRWFSAPDAAQRAAIGAAEPHRATLTDRYSPVLGAALAVPPGAIAAAGRLGPLLGAPRGHHPPGPLVSGAAALTPENLLPPPICFHYC